jgi:hypothetical protein
MKLTNAELRDWVMYLANNKDGFRIDKNKLLEFINVQRNSSHEAKEMTVEYAYNLTQGFLLAYLSLIGK